MRKYIICFLFCAFGLFSCNTGDPIVVDNPYTSSSSDSHLFIQKVEINNQYTIIDFVSMNNVEDTASFEWITLDADSYIQTLNGKKYKMLKAEGVSISRNKEGRTYFATIDNYIHFRLFFEPIPKKTKILSFIEPNGWHIDDISLVDVNPHGPLRYKYHQYELKTGSVDPSESPTILAISAFEERTYDEHSMYFFHKMTGFSVQVRVSDCKDFYADYNTIVNNGYLKMSQSFSDTEYRVREFFFIDTTEIVAGDIYAYYKDNKKYEIIYLWNYGFTPLDNLIEQYIADNAVAIVFDKEEFNRIAYQYIPLTKVYSVGPNCIHTRNQDFEVTNIELRDDCTLIHKRCTATLKNEYLSVFSTTDEYIEDAISGKKYYLQRSTLSLDSTNPSVMEPNSSIDFVETYPAISGIQYLNINSGTAYYLKNIDISQL